MNARSTSLFFCAVFFSSLSCDSSTQKAQDPPSVLKLYQHHFDRNEFDDAKKYSTPAGQKWIDGISPLMDIDPLQPTTLNTHFHKIDCQINLDTAICFCKLEDENEYYEAVYRLINIEGQWLVDAPDEEASIEYENDEEILPSSDFFQ